MPPYLVNIVFSCEDRACSKSATVALYNGVNAIIGRYCQKHGKAALAELRRAEVEG